VTLRIVPVTRDQANEFVRRLHRHSRPVVGDKCAIGAVLESSGKVGIQTSTLVGVAIVGRPVAIPLDDNTTAEITRVCTDGTHNACSFLYGAARRLALAMGYERVLTYTLPDEGGASLRAAGFRLDKTDAGGPAALWHSRPGRSARPVGDDLLGGKWRWVSP
jgi:hypothetical protein